MPTEISIVMRRDMQDLADDARISEKYLPATHISAKSIELRTTLPSLAEVFIAGHGVRISGGERTYTGDISVRHTDILSRGGPVSRHDLNAIVEMGKELRAIRDALGIDK